jgi:hypothetical protein
VGENEGLLLRAYAVDFRTEILSDGWQPNLENMAAVTILSINKNPLLTKQETQRRFYTIGKNKVVEIASLYTAKGEIFVQRVLHISLTSSTWSLKATYRAGQEKEAKMVTEIFKSVSVKKSDK